MENKTQSWVLVLEDMDGAIYTLTPEVLRLGAVETSEHESKVLKYIQSDNGPSKIEDAFPGFKVLGAYKRESDPRIKRNYTPPQMKLVSSESHPNP